MVFYLSYWAIFNIGQKKGNVERRKKKKKKRKVKGDSVLCKRLTSYETAVWQTKLKNTRREKN